MRLHYFLAKQRSLLAHFEIHWRQNMEKEPDYFPKKMSEEEWEKQFDFFARDFADKEYDKGSIPHYEPCNKLSDQAHRP